MNMKITIAKTFCDFDFGHDFLKNSYFGYFYQDFVRKLREEVKQPCPDPYPENF